MNVNFETDISEEPIMDNNPFSLRISQLFEEVIGKLLSNSKMIDSTGDLGKSLNQKEAYIMNLSLINGRLKDTVKSVEFSEIFLRRYPNRDFLEKAGIDESVYVQYHSEMAVFKIHSILEIMKLLISAVYKLDLTAKECTWINISGRIDKNQKPMKLMDDFFKKYTEFINLRHLNSHRGIFDDKEKSELNILGYSREVMKKHHPDLIDWSQGLFPREFLDIKVKKYRKGRVNLLKKIRLDSESLVKGVLVTLVPELEKGLSEFDNTNCCD